MVDRRLNGDVEKSNYQQNYHSWIFVKPQLLQRCCSYQPGLHQQCFTQHSLLNDCNIGGHGEYPGPAEGQDEGQCVD